MKTIRRLVIPAGVLVMFLAMAATGVRAQSLFSTHFAGKFTLPFMAQWGTTVLPPGEYELYYGIQGNKGSYAVEIRGQGELPQVVKIAMGRSDAKAGENSLVCVREDNKGYVRALELPAIGESIEFNLPHGVEVESKLIAKHQNKSGNTQLAEARIRVERVPIKLSAK